MGDLARIKSDSTFELLGRGDHIAKIEDKRVSLGSIEQQLTDSPWITEAAAVALDQSGRQFVGVVLQLSGRGCDELARLGNLKFANSLKSLLGMIEPVAIPKLFRYVDAIPVNKQGKRESAALTELFE
jgi:acyl-coenzyme A synthetase/AMP-(fatty) acid ligase